MARGYCVNPGGGTTAFADNNPYGGYAEFSDATLLQSAYDKTVACVAQLTGGCAAVPTGYPNPIAQNYLP